MRLRRAAMFLVAIVVVMGCRDERRVAEPARALSAPAKPEPAVPVVPPPEAKEVLPRMFVLTVKRPADGAAAIETAKSFTLFETIYDAEGREVGGSVPSNDWAGLSKESRAQLAGMKVGEIRRVWTCTGRQPRDRCKVEGVEVLAAE